MNRTEKVIIHSNIGNISYAFTVAEMAYRNFKEERYDKKVLKRMYEFHDGVFAKVFLRDKCVTVVVDYKRY